MWFFSILVEKWFTPKKKEKTEFDAKNKMIIIRW